MKISNLSLVVGTAACNAACPFCVSKMTGLKLVGYKPVEVNWRNFHKACRMASNHGVDTVMMTGKGEPTLYPGQIDGYMEKLEKYEFPFIELQTNGILVMKDWSKFEGRLKVWYEKGLTTVSVSIVHWKKGKNQKVYTPRSGYVDLGELAKRLQSVGVMVRWSVTMVKGFVDSVDSVARMVEWTRELGVEQLTLRPVEVTTTEAENPDIYNYTVKHLVNEQVKKEVGEYLEREGKLLMSSEYGMRVYDVGGQNVAFANALTLDIEGKYMRQLIFYPDGNLTYDWQYKGARLL